MADMAGEVKIAIVEDDKLFAGTLEKVINGVPGLQVVAVYSNGEDALKNYAKEKTEILVVDLGLPGISGLDLIKELEAQPDTPEILVLTVYEDKQNVFAALKAGAMGYLTKGDGADEIIRGLEMIREGGSPMSPSIARAVIEEFQGLPDQPELILTHREKEILSYIEQGYSYMETADKLCISHHTVHSHLKRTYEKLQAKNRLQALNKARKLGVL